MAGVNKVIVVGRLGKDPELKYIPSGKAVANFSMVTSEKYNDQEYTEWHSIVAWGRLAEICGEYLSKGDLVYIEGPKRTRSYEDQDGNKRYITEIIAKSMQMLGSLESKPKQQTAVEDQGLPEEDLPF